MLSFRFPWHKFPMLLPLVCLIIGILISHYTRLHLQSPIIIFFIIIGIILSAVSVYFNKRNSILNWIFLLSSTLTMTGLGFVLHQSQRHTNNKNWYGHILEKSQFLQVKIIDNPEDKPRTTRYKTEVLSVNYNDSIWQNAKGWIDVYVYKNQGAPTLKINDIITIPADKVTAIKHNNNPYSFNYEQFARHKNKYHQAFLGYKDIIVNFISSENDLSFTEKTNRRILTSIYDNVSDSMTASMMAAVIINERVHMDRDVWTDYSRTGVAHIIAISGMHITLFVTILFFMISFISSHKYDHIKYGAAMVIVWFYILLTGLPPSAVRAGIMFSIIAVGIIFKRKQIAINSLFTTAFLSLLVVPDWLWDVGFQLSLLSVLAILVFYEPIKSLYTPKNKIIDFIWSTIALSTAVQILLTPIIIYYFHQFSIWSVIANIPAALYSTIFMIITLIIIFIGSFGISVTWLGDVNAYITIQFNKLIHIFSENSWDTLHHLHLDQTTMWLSYILIILMSLYIYSRKKILLISGMTTCVIVLGVIFYQHKILSQQQYICLYQSNSNTIIDIVAGHDIQRFSTQSFTANDSQYIFKPHEINAHLTVSETNIIQDNFAFEWKGKKILFWLKNLNYGETNSQTFDYIIISNKDIILNDAIFDKIKSHHWVISSEIPMRQSEFYKHLFSEKQLNFSYIRDSGALIIN